MGFFLSKLATMWQDFNTCPASAAMVGLDGAGKTTITYKLALNEVVTTIPTIGFNVQTVSPCKGLTLTIWDVGGQEIIRKLWHHYYNNTDGFIYVVDSTDQVRFSEAKEELHKALEHDALRRVPVLVFANKQDMPYAVPVSKVTDALELGKLNREHKWHIQACCAVTGDGLMEGFEVFASMVKEYKQVNSKPAGLGF
ncbi:uncharacterized protein LOC100183030 [Ciona intestinalis]